jgi:hypothetical protein
MKVLFLDDDGQRHETFRTKAGHHEVDYVWTADEAIKAMEGTRYDLACLDHDLGGRTFVPSDGVEPTGYTVAKAIADGQVQAPARVIVHSFNPVGAKHMIDCLRQASVSCIQSPFGTFRLPERAA